MAPQRWGKAVYAVKYFFALIEAPSLTKAPARRTGRRSPGAFGLVPGGMALCVGQFYAIPIWSRRRLGSHLRFFENTELPV